MAWHPTLYAVAGVATAAVSWGLAGVAWRHREERIAVPFAGLTLALGAWSLVYGIQLGFTTLGAQAAWQGITLAVAGTVPTLWLVFTLRYVGNARWVSRRRLALLAVDPVAFALLAVTNPLHGLVWTDARLVPDVAGPVLQPAFGPGYAVHIAYAYLAVAAGIVLLLATYVRAARMYRKQIASLVIAALPPFATHVLYTVGGTPFTAADLTPYVFAFTGVALGLALFRFDLLERSPVARERAIEEMGDGLVVVDQHGVVVDVDPVARTVLDPPPRVGAPLSDALPDASPSSTSGHVGTVSDAGRTYDLHLSPLHDHSGHLAGHFLLLRDVSERHAYEQRLEVSNRVLRHNLRNDMNVVAGFARELEEDLDGADAETARIIRATAEELVDLSEKVREMTTFRRGDLERAATIDVVAPVTRLVEEWRGSNPGVAFDLDAPAEAWARVVGEETFESVVRNIVENAVEHNDDPRPRVHVAVRSNEADVEITVADDGGGIPVMEQTVIGGGLETPLHHSQGIGLWLAHWGVTASGGDISFDAGDGGTTVTLSFPRGAPPK